MSIYMKTTIYFRLHESLVFTWTFGEWVTALNSGSYAWRAVGKIKHKYMKGKRNENKSDDRVCLNMNILYGLSILTMADFIQGMFSWHNELSWKHNRFIMGCGMGWDSWEFFVYISAQQTFIIKHAFLKEETDLVSACDEIVCISLDKHKIRHDVTELTILNVHGFTWDFFPAGLVICLKG